MDGWRELTREEMVADKRITRVDSSHFVCPRCDGTEKGTSRYGCVYMCVVFYDKQFEKFDLLL